ncbi:MAG: hypothetical protein HC860_19160 [Alkalinema sp. RU_4_3]|nr:hypothetical protein [Alkalinema sp. RU_4_3]
MHRQVYSTVELIEILAQERRNCMAGRRLDLAATPSGINPLLDRFIESVGIQKFTAYENFRTTIHQYQHEHQVSGLVGTQIQVGEEILQFPRLHEQLVSLQSDRRRLRAAKAQVVAFWRDCLGDMALFLSVQQGKVFETLDLAGAERIIHRSEWAVIEVQGRDRNLEIILQLGWGKPEEALYRRGFPESGSEFIHAVFPGKHPI